MRGLYRFGPSSSATVVALLFILGAASPAVGAAPLSAEAGSTHPSPYGTTTTVRACTERALVSAVNAGGTVKFGLNCAALAIKTPISIPSARTVNITSGGFSVTLDGGSASRLFIVPGGHLNITGISLDNGAAVGTTGKGGANRVAGANGLSGTSGNRGVTGGPGGPGMNGTNGHSGRAGGAGTAGGDALGGAIWVQSGVVVLAFDSFSYDIASAGFGGNGGVGGDGGLGGSGGYGGDGGDGASGSAGGPAGVGGPGGTGGAGGSGGNGGNAGAGGNAEGGAIYNGGTLLLVNDTFTGGGAFGGAGGDGNLAGAGAAGGPGGDGGSGGGGGSPTYSLGLDGAPPGQDGGGGAAGSAGTGGSGGDGGAAGGGQVYNASGT